MSDTSCHYSHNFCTKTSVLVVCINILMGWTFCLFFCSTSLSGIRPWEGGGSSSSGYGSSQLLSIQVCSLWVYSSLRYFGVGYSCICFFSIVTRPLSWYNPDLPVQVKFCMKGLIDGDGCAQRSVKLRKIPSVIADHTYTHMPPSLLMMSTPSNRLYPSSSPSTTRTSILNIWVHST